MDKVKKGLIGAIAVCALATTGAIVSYCVTNTTPTVSTVAEDTVTMTLKTKTIAYEDKVQIVYGMDLSGVPEAYQDDVKMLFWNAVPASGEFINGSQTYYVEANGNYSNTSYTAFYSHGLAAKELANVVYCRTYVQIDNVDYYSAVKKYSVTEYVSNRIAAGSSYTNLFNSLLNYGAEAQLAFDYNTENLANELTNKITVVDGTLSDGFTTGMYKTGTSVTITANEKEGYTFVGWANAAGTIVSENKTYTFSVSASVALTATYERSASQGLAYTLSDDQTYYSVTGIGTCSDTDIIIPSTYEGKPVTAIGDDAFSDCSSLTSITVPDSVTVISSRAFYNCSSLTNVTIPDSVTSIGGGYTFYNCSSLTSVTIGNSVTSIGDYTFAYCSSLTSIVIPDSVTSIGYEAFYNCSSLTSVNISNSVTNIGERAFNYCSSLTNITIPDSVTSISRYAFENCRKLTSVTIPDSVTSIGEYAFSECSSLTSVTIPESVTSIGWYAFYGCSSHPR